MTKDEIAKTFSDAEMKALRADYLSQPQRDPIGAAIMRERAAEEVGHHLSTPEDVVWADDAASRIEALPLPTHAETLDYALQLPEIKALTAENERLREALAPLATMAERYDPDEGDDGDLECWSGLAVPKIKHLRIARAALETKP